MAAISFSHRMYSSSVICSCSSTTGSVSSVEESSGQFSHILNASHQTAKQETVPQGLQSLSLQAVHWKRQSAFQRNTDGKLSVTVYFFIDNGEQCILNGRSGFPYLVQESNGGRRQITIDNTLIRIFVFQFGNGDRTEYFVRRTES